MKTETNVSKIKSKLADEINYKQKYKLYSRLKMKIGLASVNNSYFIGNFKFDSSMSSKYILHEKWQGIATNFMLLSSSLLNLHEY